MILPVVGPLNYFVLFFEVLRNAGRLQNMILAVGPGTPASLLMGNEQNVSVSTNSSSEEDDSESTQGERSENEGEGEFVSDSRSARRSLWLSRNQSEESGDIQEDDVDIQHHDQGIDNNEGGRSVGSGDVSVDRDDDSGGGSGSEHTDDCDIHNRSAPVPSIRHGGCINTAAWMDCGWRISLPGGMARDAIHTHECPTQLVTSGDDLLVKFWDVSQAIGMTTPLAGGPATICPYSAPEPQLEQPAIIDKWRRYYQETNSDAVAGAVLPLAIISTGHMSNVFHVTPLRGQPGKVATCAADGFLRLGDLETGQSRVVVRPEVDTHALRLAMCFSHHFLSQNTGLLCTEQGLRRFDLRIPSGEQPSGSLLAGASGCKACAIWSTSKSSSALEEGDSVYVFCKLYCLRYSQPWVGLIEGLQIHFIVASGRVLARSHTLGFTNGRFGFQQSRPNLLSKESVHRQ
jgi:hypothetical protein